MHLANLAAASSPFDLGARRPRASTSDAWRVVAANLDNATPRSRSPFPHGANGGSTVQGATDEDAECSPPITITTTAFSQADYPRLLWGADGILTWYLLFG